MTSALHNADRFDIPESGKPFSISGKISRRLITFLPRITCILQFQFTTDQWLAAAANRALSLTNSRRILALLIFLLPTPVACSMDALAFLRATPKAALAAPEKPLSDIQPTNEHLARKTLDVSNFYDPGNPELIRLQKISEATRSLPYDTAGFPDWMRALREGLIEPRSDLYGKSNMEVLDLDIIMKNTREMPFVRFPHRSHTLWLACSNCHPEPFKPIAGSTAIRMADIFRGQYCGMCHDRVAFITFFSCNRCHSVSQPVSGKQ